MVDFNWSETDRFDLNELLMSKWLEDTCLSESRSLGDISVIFCTDDELLRTNQEFLDHDYYTDIITFDYSEENTVSGDLFVSIDRIRDNAKNLKVSFDEELCRVLVHGILHLCGFGDKSPEDEVVMRRKEDFYLNKLKGFT